MLRNESCARLNYLCEVGLGYLTLDRSTRTLSGGEVQRVNLTTCLGASLVNTLFVMDEPSIGLHPRDVGRLVRVMHDLRDKGNTLLVVEHEEAIIRAADNLIDIGPGRGEGGGELVLSGRWTDFSMEPARPRAATHHITGARARRLHPLRAIILTAANRSQFRNRAANRPPRSRSPARASTTSKISMSKFRSAFSRASPAFPVPANRRSFTKCFIGISCARKANCPIRNRARANR